VDSDIVSCYTVYSVLDAANKAQAERDESKWRYTKTNGEVIVLRDRFDKIVEGFTKYAGLIGTTVQPQRTEATSLVWAAARSLVEVVTSNSYSISQNADSTIVRSTSIIKRMRKC
jgi:hypothetical protein